MEQKVIFCDIDGVVADLGTEWLRRYNADYDDQLDYYRDINGWDMAQFVKPECGKKIFEYLHLADLYDGVLPIEGALAGVQELRARGYRVVFATATNVNQAGNKLRWLARHGFLELKYGSVSYDYIEVYDKHLLRGFALIDDGAHNLRGFQGWRILYDTQHNRQETDSSFVRARGEWPGVVSLFEPVK